MEGFLTSSPATISAAAFFGSVGPIAAKEYEVWRGDVTSYMLGWGFDTMGQCQAVSAGAVMIACAILFSLAPPTPARRLPASITGNNEGSTPVELVAAGVMS